MSEVVVTRVESGGPLHRARNLEERLMVRFPGLYRRLAALAQRRLSPGSRLRRAMLRRAFVSGWAAYNRGDFELMLVRYAQQVEFEFAPGLQTLGLDGKFRGHGRMAEGLRELAEVSADELEPAYQLDLGHRVLHLGFRRAHARASGVRLAHEFAQLVTVGAGLVKRDQAWFTWEEGLRAAGLDPDAFALPRPGEARQEPVPR